MSYVRPVLQDIILILPNTKFVLDVYIDHQTRFLLLAYWVIDSLIALTAIVSNRFSLWMIYEFMLKEAWIYGDWPMLCGLTHQFKFEQKLSEYTIPNRFILCLSDFIWHFFGTFFLLLSVSLIVLRSCHNIQTRPDMPSRQFSDDL